MTARVTKGRQDEIRQSDAYDDTLAPGAHLETDGTDIEYDENAIRSILKHLSGLDHWCSARGSVRSIKGLHDALVAGVARAYQLSSERRVPGGGTLYLCFGRVPTSAAPFATDANMKLRAATIMVDTADTNPYTLEVLVNGSVVETLVLPATEIKAITSGFTASVASSDDIALRLVRASGNGVSDFSKVTACLVMDEAA